MKYDTKLFMGMNGYTDAFFKYEKWLKQCNNIEIVSINTVGKYNDAFFVTYIFTSLPIK